MATVEDLLRTVLNNKEAKIFKKSDEQLTVQGIKAQEHLKQILFAVAEYLEYTDDRTGIQIHLSQVEDLIDNMNRIIERGI